MMTVDEMNAIIAQASAEIRDLRAKVERLEVELFLYRRGVLQPLGAAAEFQKDYDEDQEGLYR
jgi:hypothetical protein